MTAQTMLPNLNRAPQVSWQRINSEEHRAGLAIRQGQVGMTSEEAYTLAGQGATDPPRLPIRPRVIVSIPRFPLN